MLFTRYGQAVRFNIGEVRSTGRASYGVIGMTLDDGDKVIAMQLTSQGDSALIVSEKVLASARKSRNSRFTTEEARVSAATRSPTRQAMSSA